MSDQIIRALTGSGADGWRLTIEEQKQAEGYFIQGKLDIPRLVRRRRISAEIFRDFESGGERYRGSSKVFFEEGMEEKEIRDKISSALFAASFVKNPFYGLGAGSALPHRPSAANTASLPLMEVLKMGSDLFTSVKGEGDAFINSAELFATRKTVRILDSEGCDVSYSQDLFSGEFVTECTRPRDTEQYRAFSFEGFEGEALRKKIEGALSDAKNRSRAEKSPKAGCVNLLLSGENLRTLLSFYLARSSAAYIYPGYSSWKIGETVQTPSLGGEKLNLLLAPDRPFSGEGIPLKERVLLEDGVLKSIHGGLRLCSYLGIEPTGDYEKLILKGGSHSLSELSRNCLEAVSFSDFQMDPMDGHFGGELRLGLVRDEKGRALPVAGGSVSGNLLSSQGGLLFSRERYTDRTYEGPLAALIPLVTVAGE